MEPAGYRAAADRCRKTSPSSADSHEWIRFAQNWEKVAKTTETLSVNKLKRAKYVSLSLSNPGSW